MGNRAPIQAPGGSDPGGSPRGHAHLDIRRRQAQAPTGSVMASRTRLDGSGTESVRTPWPPGLPGPPKPPPPPDPPARLKSTEPAAI
jgi:hypothetical protein